MTAIKITHAGQIMITTSWTLQEDTTTKRTNLIYLEKSDYNPTGVKHQRLLLPFKAKDMIEYIAKNAHKGVVDLDSLIRSAPPD